MSDDTQLSEEQLMQVIEKIGKEAVPKTLPMLPDVQVKLTNTHRLDIANQADRLSNETQVAVRSRIMDEPSGYVVVMLSYDDMETLARTMLSGVYEDMSDVGEDAMQDAAQELGNLIISDYLDAIAKVSDGNVDYKAPSILTDDLQQIAVNTSKKSSNRYAFIYKIAAKVDDDTVSFYIYHFPELDEMVELAESLI